MGWQMRRNRQNIAAVIDPGVVPLNNRFRGPHHTEMDSFGRRTALDVVVIRGQGL